MTHIDESVSKTHKRYVSVPSVLQRAVCERSRLFPNPAQNQITLQSSEASENLELTIHDISTRVITKHHLKTSNFIATLDLNLLNGVYLISIENSDHKKVIKKLLIAK